MLGFVQGGKLEYREKNTLREARSTTNSNQNQNRNRATLVGGEHSHHCTIAAPCAAKNLCLYGDPMLSNFHKVLNFEIITVFLYN